MQYILSEEEYNNLKQNNKQEDAKAKRKLEVFCHMVADTMPLLGWWNETEGVPDPWVCRHTRGKPDESGYVEEHYCDQCPCRDICPSEQDYSQ